METNSNYELVMKDLISYLFPPKTLQLRKRYLRRGIYKTRDTKIQYFMCRIDKIVEYLGNFPPLRAGQSLPEDKILELLGFLLLKECYK